MGLFTILLNLGIIGIESMQIAHVNAEVEGFVKNKGRTSFDITFFTEDGQDYVGYKIPTGEIFDKQAVGLDQSPIEALIKFRQRHEQMIKLKPGLYK